MRMNIFPKHCLSTLCNSIMQTVSEKTKIQYRIIKKINKNTCEYKSYNKNNLHIRSNIRLYKHRATDIESYMT